MVAFLRERYKGGRPVAWGRQLQELWVATGIYWGTLGVDAFESTGVSESPARSSAARRSRRGPRRPGLERPGSCPALTSASSERASPASRPRSLPPNRAPASTSWRPARRPPTGRPAGSTPAWCPALERHARRSTPLAGDPGHPYRFLGAGLGEALDWLRAILAAEGLELSGTPRRSAPSGADRHRRDPAGGHRARGERGRPATVGAGRDARRLRAGGLPRLLAGVDRGQPPAAARLARGRRTGPDRGRVGRAPGRRRTSEPERSRRWPGPSTTPRGVERRSTRSRRAIDRAWRGPGRVAFPAVLGLQDHPAVARRRPTAAAAGASSRFRSFRRASRACASTTPCARRCGDAADGSRSARPSTARSRRTVRCGRCPRRPPRATSCCPSGAVVLATGGIAGGGIVGTADGRLVEPSWACRCTDPTASPGCGTTRSIPPAIRSRPRGS